jgi:hypothetical protein
MGAKEFSYSEEDGFIKHEPGMLWSKMMVEMARSGDATATSELAFVIMAHMEAGAAVPPELRDWVKGVMLKIHSDPDLALLVARPAGTLGPPEKGYASFQTAWRVFERVFDGAPTMEIAWAETAKLVSLSEETVKRHWIANKARVLAVLEPTKPPEYDSMDQLLKAILRGNRGGDRGGKKS